MIRTSSRWLLAALLVAAVQASCSSGQGAGGRCRTNGDCMPGLYCAPTSGTCEALAGTDAGPGVLDAGGGTDAGGSTDTGLPAPVCGDGECELAESCKGCPADCGACTATCGDDTCDVNESCVTCPSDCGACGPVCGDGECDAPGETCVTCPSDCGGCGPVCGDALCEPPEACASCPSDCGACGAVCGNAICEPGETPCGCAGDCGPCLPVCGNGLLEMGEECEDGNLLPGDGCGPLCNAEDPCIRSPLPATTSLGSVAAGTTDDGEWHLDISPSYFNFQGQMRSLFSIGTNGYVRPGLTGYLAASAYADGSTDADAQFASGNSSISWLGGDGDMDVATATYDLDAAGDRLVLHFEAYGAWSTPGSSTNVQLIFHLTSGTFEILYLEGNFTPAPGRDWSIGVSEPNLDAGGACDVWDFEAAAPGSMMTVPLGCIVNHTTGPAAAALQMGSHYAPLAGHSLCFVKGATDYEVRFDPIVAAP